MRRFLSTTLMLLTGCGHQSGDSADPVGAPSVGVRPVTLDTLSETIAIDGRLTPMPGRSAVLTAPADAVVRAIPVTVGEAVASGQLLIRLDAPELTTSARSLTAQAHSDSLDLERQRALFQQGITSRRQLEEREAAAASSRAQAEAAGQLLHRADLLSPLAGGVQRLLAQVGERVAAGQALVEIVNSDGLDLHAGVPAALLARVRPGQSVQVMVEGLDSPITGKVQAIAPAIDSLSGLGEIVVRLPAAPGLRAGAGANGTIRTQLLRQAIVVADSAIVPAESGVQVFVVGPDSVARSRSVKISARSNGRVAIVGELHAGELVVVNGGYGLTDSTRVVPVAAP